VSQKGTEGSNPSLSSTIERLSMSEEAVAERLSRNELNLIAKTISEPLQEGTFTLALVGNIRSEDRGGIQEGAEILMKMDGIETVVVCAIANSAKLIGYLVTKSATVEPKQWIEELFSTDSEIVFTLENNAEVVFEIPLGFFASCKDRAALWALTKNLLTDRFLSKIGKVVE
jgi:hypothetical protein